MAGNLSFDVDALFDHLRGTLGHDPEAELEWSFTFRSDDYRKLASLADSLADDFAVHLQEKVETFENDKWFDGPPMLAASVTGALTPDEVKELFERFKGLAEEEGLVYEGVSASEPFDIEAAFGWLQCEDAVWRLRHFTDTGLPEGEPITWVFAIAADDAAGLQRAEQALRALGVGEVEREDDGEGNEILILRREGANDGEALAAAYAQVEALASAAGAELIGAQFDDMLSDSELEEFESDDDDE